MSIDYQEPRISINGVELDVPQSMAIRVAIGHMLIDLQDPLHLGDDEHGRFMTQAYKARLEEVRELVFRSRS